MHICASWVIYTRIPIKDLERYCPELSEYRLDGYEDESMKSVHVPSIGRTKLLIGEDLTVMDTLLSNVLNSGLREPMKIEYQPGLTLHVKPTKA